LNQNYDWDRSLGWWPSKDLIEVDNFLNSWVEELTLFFNFFFKVLRFINKNFINKDTVNDIKLKQKYV